MPPEDRRGRRERDEGRPPGPPCPPIPGKRREPPSPEIRWLRLVREAVRMRRDGTPGWRDVPGEVGALYSDPARGGMVAAALGDPFFPLTLFDRRYVAGSGEDVRKLARRAEELCRLSQMYNRIRKDIARLFGNDGVTCINLNGDAEQEAPRDQWCSFCGKCCQLKGIVPDPPYTVRYPGYWYSYLAGDGPILQAFCPFLFELPPRGIFFCAIHHIKPLTCAAFGREDCLEKYPGRAGRKRRT